MKNIFLIPVVFLFLGCASGLMSGGNHFQLKPYKEVKLDNGLTLLLIPDNSLPRINLSMLVKVGSVHDLEGQEGSNSLVAALLDQGTGKRSAEQLSDEFNQLGTEILQASSYDYTTIQVSGLSTTKDKLLELFADVIINPAFSQSEINRTRSQTIAQLKKMIDEPSRYADYLLSKEIFGKHPYARLSGGNIPSVEKLSRADLVRHYFKFYRPNNSILAITGHFDDAYINQVKATFASWQPKDMEKNQISPVATSASDKIILFSKPDLKQTQLRWGQIGLRRADDDFLKMRLAFMVLGGSFASRLMQHVRDDKGLTYSISAASDARLQPGEFVISTFTRNEKANETIQETRKVLSQFAAEGITKSELDAAKALIIGQFPAALETTDRLALNLMLLRLYGVSDDYLHSFHKRVNEITVSDVNAAIRKNFQWQQMNLIVYADKKAVEDQLKSLGQLKIEEVSTKH